MEMFAPFLLFWALPAPAQVAPGPIRFLPIIRGVPWFGQVAKTTQRVISTVEHREVPLKAT